jgi:triosephosphate isomerase (TIM)
MNYLVANWKSNKTLAEVQHWFDELGPIPYDQAQLTVIICPPNPFFLATVDLIERHTIAVKAGVQDVSPYPFGSYTGAVAAEMVSEWARFAIVGHSERRRYFGEDDLTVLAKTERVLEAGMIPIVCVDEPYMGTLLGKLPSDSHERIVVAYEPLAAIGSGDPAEPEHVSNIARRIKELTSQATPVLYGGSTNAANLKDYTDLSLVAGALVGGASLDPAEWKAMITGYSLAD